MHIQDFIGGYKNHPVLFVGTGFSLRYLENSYTWDGLLRKIAYDIEGNDEFYLDIKSSAHSVMGYDYPKIASLLEARFNGKLKADRNGNFKEINDLFYKNMEEGINISRFKIYIARLLGVIDRRKEVEGELTTLNKARKNIGSIITTNYDRFLEEIFEFIPLIGNNILLSEPYGSLYKIHGSTEDPSSIIINQEDYSNFNQRYELIRAQLLSIFIHNPIIFLGYSINDDNIKSILRTIFRYVPPNSDLARDIRKNFLLVEYDKGSQSEDVIDHDIDIEGYSTIRINKISTDNYSVIYKCIADLHLPISAMDIRKVQSVFKEIRAGGDIKVRITEDINSLQNSDKILVIGSDKSVRYEYRNKKDLIWSYFEIIEEENRDVIKVIDKLNVQMNEWFPMFQFDRICPGLTLASKLKDNQIEKIRSFIEGSIPLVCKSKHVTIDSVMEDDSIAVSYKNIAIAWNVYNDNISLDQLEEYLKSAEDWDSNTRRLLCIYDYKSANAVSTS